MTEKSRTPVLIAVLALISVPAVLALAEAVSFHALNRNNGSITSSGQRRDYLLHVPVSYDRTRPTPLVISMHGGAMWPAAQMRMSRWNEVAEREGFIVLYPSGIDGAGPRHWRMGGSELDADVRFISELIDTLNVSWNIDSTRIYADGLSNGGGMAFVLSCAMSHRIAAVGMVASAQLLPWRWCTDRNAVPMIAFHGTEDRQVPYQGGESWVTPSGFPSMVTWARNWAERNGCAGGAVDSAVAPDVTRLAYAGCVGDADVVLYTLHGGGHTWPGGEPMSAWFIGHTTQSVDASSLMWAFYRDHPLRRSQP